MARTRLKELVPFGTSQQIAHRESANDDERAETLRTLSDFMKELIKMLGDALSDNNSTGEAPKKASGDTPIDGDFSGEMEAWRRGWKPSLTEADEARAFAARLR
jgi:hypothetical protein